MLSTLSDGDRALLTPHLTRVELGRRQVLVKPNTPVEQVYFPEGGVISIVSVMRQGGRIEAGIFGRDGVSATCLLLGTDRTPQETFVQVNGSTALRIDASRYLEAVGQSETLRTVLLRYVQTALVQSAQSMATNANQRIEARLARWLLMCHDRIDGDEIALTHEFIGMMIAADRSGVAKEPITPNRVASFRHGAEALAARLNDDPGSELDTEPIRQFPDSAAGYTKCNHERNCRAEHTVNGCPGSATIARRDGPIDRLTRSPPGPLTLHVLEGAGIIRSERGRVIIRDRDKLEELAGDAYGTPEAEYRRLIGPIGQRSVVLPFVGRAEQP